MKLLELTLFVFFIITLYSHFFVVVFFVKFLLFFSLQQMMGRLFTEVRRANLKIICSTDNIANIVSSSNSRFENISMN